MTEKERLFTDSLWDVVLCSTPSTLCPSLPLCYDYTPPSGTSEETGSEFRISHRPCRRFSFPTCLFHKHECHNDIVQHFHSLRFNFKSRLLFVDNVVWPVELCDHRLLLISGDQLHIVIQYLDDIGELFNELTLPGFIPIAPRAHLYRTPSGAMNVKLLAFKSDSVHSPNAKSYSNSLTLSSSHTWARTRAGWLFDL